MVTESEDFKLGYIVAYSDHLVATHTALNKAQPEDFLDVLLKDKYVEYDDAMPTTLNIGEIIKGLDVFFAEPANANITVRHALFIFTGKAKGWSSALLQSLTEMARKADN